MAGIKHVWSWCAGLAFLLVVITCHAQVMNCSNIVDGFSAPGNALINLDPIYDRDTRSVSKTIHFRDQPIVSSIWPTVGLIRILGETTLPTGQADCYTSCSAISIAPNLVITAAHCAKDLKIISKVLYWPGYLDGKNIPSAVELDPERSAVGSPPEGSTDYLIFAVKKGGKPLIAARLARYLLPGDFDASGGYLLGHPFGGPQQISSGSCTLLSAERMGGFTPPDLQIRHQCLAADGFSGGAIFGRDGALLAMHSGRVDGETPVASLGVWRGIDLARLLVARHTTSEPLAKLSEELKELTLASEPRILLSQSWKVNPPGQNAPPTPVRDSAKSPTAPPTPPLTTSTGMLTSFLSSFDMGKQYSPASYRGFPDATMEFGENVRVVVVKFESPLFAANAVPGFLESEISLSMRKARIWHTYRDAVLADSLYILPLKFEGSTPQPQASLFCEQVFEQVKKQFCKLVEGNCNAPQIQPSADPFATCSAAPGAPKSARESGLPVRFKTFLRVQTGTENTSSDSRDAYYGCDNAGFRYFVALDLTTVTSTSSCDITIGTQRPWDLPTKPEPAPLGSAGGG